MPPERQSRLRLVGVTAFVSFIATLAGVAAVATVVSRQPPPTPQLARAKSISVTLYPMRDFNFPGCPRTEVPVGDIEHVMRLVTPDVYYSGGVSDWITPLIAEVIITHEGQKDTHLLVRWAGKNPATISVDGRHYFYGTTHEDIGDGGIQLVALVRRLAEVKPR